MSTRGVCRNELASSHRTPIEGEVGGGLLMIHIMTSCTSTGSSIIQQQQLDHPHPLVYSGPRPIASPYSYSYNLRHHQMQCRGQHRASSCHSHRMLIIPYHEAVHANYGNPNSLSLCTSSIAITIASTTIQAFATN